MGRKALYLEYLKGINPISEYIKDSPKSDKSLKTYLSALNRIFPYLVNRFKDETNYTDFDLDEFLKLNSYEKELIIKEWENNDIPNLTFEKWKELTSNKKADILMKWSNDQFEQNSKSVNGGKKNTYLVYAWSVQGLLSKLGREYEANPKNMKQMQASEFHLTDGITYEDVIDFYDKLESARLRLILKLIMYSGLNPADIVLLKPEDFRKAKDRYYYVSKDREKTKEKGVKYLLIFSECFFNEIKDFFEMKIIKNLKKESKSAEIKKYRKDLRYKIRKETSTAIEFEYHKDWEKDKKCQLFGDSTARSISDNFRYHIQKHNLNEDIKPQDIRRLCFTRLRSIFSLADKDIYDVWTQHKVKMITRSYITDLIERIIPYLETGKIQTRVLIESGKNNYKKVVTFTKGMGKIADLEEKNLYLNRKIDSLESNNNELKNSVNFLTEQIKNVNKFMYVNELYDFLNDFIKPEIFDKHTKDFTFLIKTLHTIWINTNTNKSAKLIETTEYLADLGNLQDLLDEKRNLGFGDLKGMLSAKYDNAIKMNVFLK